jgi:hypothetical protein
LAAHVNRPGVHQDDGTIDQGYYQQHVATFARTYSTPRCAWIW